MLSPQRQARPAHLPRLICPMVLSFSMASALVALSQAPHRLVGATTLPNASRQTSSAQLAHVEIPPTPEQLGDTWMFHQRYQAAIESYSKAEPTSGIWNKMGMAYQMMFSTSGAMHCYQESLRLNPENANTLNNVGSTLFSLKRFTEAERMYRKALALDPHSATVQMNLGTNLIAENRFEDGWKHYQAALKIDPHVFEYTRKPCASAIRRCHEERGAVSYYLARGFAQVAGMVEHGNRSICARLSIRASPVPER
jgi:Tfp pilus assembly protein PilF